MEIGVKYTIEITEMYVSQAGQDLIADYMLNNSLPISGLSSSNWTWDWVRQSGRYRGKLPKRLAHMIKYRHELVLTPEQMSEIGNIARDHILSSIIYTLDFDDGLDWGAGDFGDFGSCFWTCHTPARNELEKQGVLAIRLYNEKATGYARAWVYKIDDDTWILFNAYGVTTQVMANIFTTFLTDKTTESWKYSGIHLTVNEDTGGLIYLNACPQAVYVEGTVPSKEIDLDWDMGDYVLCYYCEAYVEAGTEYYYRGRRYCSSCFEEVAVCCSTCGDVILDEDDEYTHDGCTLCSCCYDNL